MAIPVGAGLRMVAWLAIGAWVVALSALSRHADGDMYHGMSLAREAIRLGGIPMHDLFAYTPTVFPFVHHEWGTGLVLYVVGIVSGLNGSGILLLKYVLLSLLVGACYLNARRRGAADAVLLACAPMAAIMIGVGFSTVRAQLFTLAFTALSLLLLHAERSGRRGWLFGWLLLYTVWLNLHAGFVVGVGLLCLHFAERAACVAYHERSIIAVCRVLRPLAIALPAMALLVLLNPYGVSYLVYLREALTMARPYILEWQPLWKVQGAWFFGSAWLASLLLFAAAMWYGRRQWSGPLLVLVCAALAFRHARHLSIYGVVWLCYVPSMVTDSALGARIDAAWRRDARTVLVALMALTCIGTAAAVKQRFWHLHVPTMPSGSPLLYPAGAVEYLAQRTFRGNVMTPFNQGAYVSWHLYPAVKVSVDARYEAAYPAGAFKESLAFYAADAGWEDTLQRYATDVVLAPMEAPVTAHLARRPGWVRVYEDVGFALFARSDVPGLPPTIRRGLVPVASFP